MTHLSEAILNDTKGMSFSLADPAALGMVKDKLDFVILDATARNFAADTLAHFIAAAGDMPFFVRVENCHADTLQKYLTAGVDGLILTGLHYASEVEKAIAHCLYPPEGIRSFTNHSTKNVSLAALNDQLTLIVEVAHPQTVAQIGDIADVTGVDGLLIAPVKLAVAMERGFETDHIDVQQAIRNVATVAESFELSWGWEGLLPSEMLPSFHVLASDRDVFEYGLEHLFPVIEEAEEDDDDVAAGLRAVR